MEATWVGMHMWAQAVAKAGTTDVDKVRAAMAGHILAQAALTGTYTLNPALSPAAR